MVRYRKHPDITKLPATRLEMHAAFKNTNRAIGCLLAHLVKRVAPEEFDNFMDSVSKLQAHTYPEYVDPFLSSALEDVLEGFESYLVDGFDEVMKPVEPGKPINSVGAKD